MIYGNKGRKSIKGESNSLKTGKCRNKQIVYLETLNTNQIVY